MSTNLSVPFCSRMIADSKFCHLIVLLLNSAFCTLFNDSYHLCLSLNSAVIK